LGHFVCHPVAHKQQGSVTASARIKSMMGFLSVTLAAFHKILEQGENALQRPLCSYLWNAYYVALVKILNVIYYAKQRWIWPLFSRLYKDSTHNEVKPSDLALSKPFLMCKPLGPYLV
jgi:hypothetical protein